MNSRAGTPAGRPLLDRVQGSEEAAMIEQLGIGPDLAVGMGQPRPEDLARLARAGFRAVVDLRQEEAGMPFGPRAEAAEAAARGLGYLNLPVSFQFIDTAALERFDRVMAELPRPVFVHCSGGRRSGVFALAHQAIAEGRCGQDVLDQAEQLGVAYGSAEDRERLRRFVDARAAARRAGPCTPAYGAEAEGAVPATAARVRRRTAGVVNRRIDAATEASVVAHARRPEGIPARLQRLDREWDVERAVEANAAAFALAGIALAATVDRRFLLLSAVVAGFLLQHALQGWCPPVPLLRRRGSRTAREIADERVALKALRGDFHRLEHVAADPARRAAEALAAARA